MARIELWTSVFAGLSGGLAGVLWSGLVGSIWPERGADPARAQQQRESAIRLLAGAAVRAAAGSLLGFLFWLGWGLIALVSQPWYAIGALFGLLCWSALVAPTLLTLTPGWPGPRRIVAAHAVEWLLTCLTIGLLCAYSWHRHA